MRDADRVSGADQGARPPGALAPAAVTGTGEKTASTVFQRGFRSKAVPGPGEPPPHTAVLRLEGRSGVGSRSQAS